MRIDEYPQFLPWCIASRVFETGDDYVKADLVIGYKFFREKFTSHVTFTRPDRIHVHYVDGPMKNLSNQWLFIRNDDGTCTIDFDVNFEFSNPLLQGFVSIFFNEAVRRMVAAFERRAAVLFGDNLQ